MPYIPELTVERPCQGDECPHDADFILSTNRNSLIQCLEHVEHDMLPWLNENTGDPAVCVACDKHSDSTYQVDVENYSVVLCKRHVTEILTFSLTPEAYANLVADANFSDNVYILGPELYDEVGTALQPYPLGGEVVAELYFRLFSGEFDLNEDWDGNVCEHPLFINLMQERFAELAGYTITDEMAHEMLHEVLDQVDTIMEGLGDNHPTVAYSLQEKYRPVILDILKKVDPQGIISAGLEEKPYDKEAAWISKGIWGSEDNNIYDLYAMVCKCFKFTPTDDRDHSFDRFMNRITAQLIAQVVLPMQKEMETKQEDSPESDGESWKY